MPEYKIDLSKIEEWQITKDLQELDKVFAKAKSTIVQGDSVLLQRTNADSSTYTADEISTEKDLEKYKENVFKYL